MATSSELKSRVDDLTTCSICLELFDIPKSLPCLHTFCLKCLEGHCGVKLPGDQMSCPLCREEFSIPPNGLAGLKSNFFVTSLVDARNVSLESSATTDNEVQCEMCAESGEELSEIRKATVYCVDCREKLCEQCSKSHRRMRTGPHKVITIGSEDEVEMIKTRGSNCEKHKNDEVRLYCFDCKENICLVCSAVEHDQHKRQEISKAAVDFTKQIDADSSPLISLTSEVREAVMFIGTEFEKFLEGIDAECANVKTTGDEIKKIVETRVAQLIDEINTVKSETRKAFVTQKEKLEFMLLGLESFSAYCNELKSKGKPWDITRAASDLHNRATELLQTDIVPFKTYVAPSVVFMPADASTISDIIGYVHTNTCTDAQSCLESDPVASRKAEPTLPDMEKRIRGLEVDIAQLKKCKTSLQNDLRFEADKSKQLSTQLEQETQRRCAAQSEHKSLEQQVNQLKAAETQLTQELADVTDLKRSSQDQLRRLKDELYNAEQQLNEVQDQLEAEGCFTKMYTTMARELKEEVEQMSQQRTELETFAKSLEMERDSLSDQLSVERSRVEAERVSHGILEERIAKMEKERSLMQLELKDTKNRLRAVRR